MKKIYIGANWKLNFDLAEVESFFEAFKLDLLPNKELIIFPQTPLLAAVQKYQTKHFFSLGSQTNAAELQGAFTGEASAKALKSLGVTWGLVGHSERRSLFGETNEHGLKKAEQLLGQGINPLLCVGESKSIRQEGFSSVIKILKEQLATAIQLFAQNIYSNRPLVIAYEPVWSIGTGITPTLEQVEETLAWIQSYVAPKINPLSPLSIMYGGSATKDNAKDLLALPSCAGLLVGGASLKPLDLSKIYQS